MHPAPEKPLLSPWSEAARLVARWLDQRERIDDLMAHLPAMFTGVERARCQHLVYGVVRHEGRLAAEIGRLVPRPPRLILRAILRVAGYELIEAQLNPATPPATPENLTAKIVHHAVERAKSLASPVEARLVNAVVRKLAIALAERPAPPRLASAAVLAEYFSHPEWLVRRWLTQFGAEATRTLLEWNQRPAPVYARWRVDAPPPAWLTPTQWAGFFEVTSGHWAEVEALLASGQLYLQDPSTRLAVELLAPKPGEAVLDLCAAPGGKTLQIADALCRGNTGTAGAGMAGRIVAVDLPSDRQARLRENLSRVNGVDVALVEADASHGLYAQMKAHRLPTDFPAVLVDVPCTNTGVMRHRVDVKWRLQEGDFDKHGRQQMILLLAAARMVEPGGRLVYSTCSLDTEENERVVTAFLRKHGERFALEGQALSRPWETGHDGAGAFLLRRKHD